MVDHCAAPRGLTAVPVLAAHPHPHSRGSSAQEALDCALADGQETAQALPGNPGMGRCQLPWLGLGPQKRRPGEPLLLHSCLRQEHKCKASCCVLSRACAEQGKATYLSFKSYLVAKVSDKAEKKGKERREFKRALQKDVQPVHQSILAKLKPSDGTPQLTIAQRLATLEARVAALEAKLKESSGNNVTEDKQGVDEGEGKGEAVGDSDGDANEDHESASEHT